MSENGSTPAETPDNLQVPPVIEGPGRYIVYEAPDRGWIVARAVPICETCQACGCGEQAELIQVPSLVIKLASSGGFSLGAVKEAFKTARQK